jgi:TolB protein
MKKIMLVALALTATATLVNAQIGTFEQAVDVGDPAKKGSSVYDEATQTYTLKGGGSNIWFNHDEFHFLFKEIKGDFIATANFKLVGNEDGNGHRKTGWMIRENTEHDAKGVNTCLHGDGLVVMQWRLMRGAYMRDPEEEVFFPKQYFGESTIQLERKGEYVTMRMAHPGEPLEEVGSAHFPELNKELLIGLYSLAHDPDDIQEAKIWNVRISTPIDPDWHPNRLVKTISHEGVKFGSMVETVNVATRERKVLVDSDENITSATFAGNNYVIFEKGGKAFNVPVNGGEVKSINMASATSSTQSDGTYTYFTKGKNSTNQIWRKKGNVETQMTHDLDHAWNPYLSPDGKYLAYLSMSNMSNPAKLMAYQKAAIKVLPTDGGAAKTVAFIYGGKGSFEKYAWSADGKSLVFVTNSERK